MPRFDNRKFIDREFEQELFEELLQLNDTSRIMTIRDAGGTGKSQLLERFKYRCQTVRPRTAVSLIALDQLRGDSPLDLVSLAVRQLSNFGADFQKFKKYDGARISRDFTQIRASIYLQGATFTDNTGVTIAGTVTRIGEAATVSIGSGIAEFTPEQARKAEEVCLEAFFDDLRQYCMNNSVVIMLDAYEKCPSAIKEWIETSFERLLFDFYYRPKCLILVIAGRQVPDFEQRWPIEDCGKTVQSIRALGQWNKQHVEECLRVLGVAFGTEEVETFYRLILMGVPPSQVVQAMETIRTSRRTRYDNKIKC